MVKTITTKNNMVMLNANQNKVYDCKEGIIIIELNDNKAMILDIASGNDVTNSKYLSYKETNKTKVKTLFTNILYA